MTILAAVETPLFSPGAPATEYYTFRDPKPESKAGIKQLLELLKLQLNNLEKGSAKAQNIQGRISLLEGSIKIEKLRQENLQS